MPKDNNLRQRTEGAQGETGAKAPDRMSRRDTPLPGDPLFSAETDLKKTPLHALHLELGARMVPFAGYDMPVQYPAGVLKEHIHTRTAAVSLRRVAHGPGLS